MILISYIFKYINIHQAIVLTMDFNMSTDGGSNFNVAKTSTAGYSYNDEGASTEYGL